MAEIEQPQPVFCDSFEHKLDGAWRVVLPKDWRGLKVTEFFLIESSASSSICAFPRAEFEKHIASVENDPTRTDRRQRNDFLEDFGSACKRVVLDKDGRITLPQSLCEKIGIGPKNPQLELRGAVRFFRIWNKEKLTMRQEGQAMIAAAGERPVRAQDILGI